MTDFALAEYVQHKPTCLLNISQSILRKPDWCTCGLTAALAALRAGSGDSEPENLRRERDLIRRDFDRVAEEHFQLAQENERLRAAAAPVAAAHDETLRELLGDAIPLVSGHLDHSFRGERHCPTCHWLHNAQGALAAARPPTPESSERDD